MVCSGRHVLPGSPAPRVAIGSQARGRGDEAAGLCRLLPLAGSAALPASRAGIGGGEVALKSGQHGGRRDLAGERGGGG